jgi:hypothetical protein
MRPSRIFRWIVRIFLLIFTLSLSAVSFLGGFSAVTILDPDSYNINIPDGPIIVNFDVYNPNNMQIVVPFNISNAGVYELNDISLGFGIWMTYGDKLNGNQTTVVQVFEKDVYYGTIIPGNTLKTNFNGTGSDGFIFASIPDPSTEIDWTRTPHPLEFYSNFTFVSSYSLRLYTFTVHIVNFSLGYYP